MGLNTDLGPTTGRAKIYGAKYLKKERGKHIFLG